MSSSDEDKDERHPNEKSSSSAPSFVSLKSQESMGYPVNFQNVQREIDKPDISHPSLVQLDDGVKLLSPECPEMFEVEDKKHQSSTREPDAALKQILKSSLQRRFKIINEGIPTYGNTRVLNEIYTELYITAECGCGHVNDEHEVRGIEKACKRITPEDDEESIHCNDIFKPLPGDEKPVRTVLTEGIAGIGKTVTVQKFVLDWTDGKANQDLDFIFPLNFRELNFKRRENLSLLELLHGFFPETKELKIDDHFYRVMFILDGLDESRFTLDFLNNRKLTDLTESSSVDVLLTNLINRNLLPSAFLWITSRPAACSQIPPAYIDRVTAVRGFRDPQKDEYFRKRICDEALADKIISHLKSSRSLYIICHMPVFCWIAATVLEEIFRDSEPEDVPKTLTQMFTHFLVLQIKRRSIKYKNDEISPEQIAEIVQNLGKLAFQHLEKGNLIFYEKDISECGIDVQEATVYSGVCTQIFIEEVILYLGKVYSFVHLSVQEHLAAVFVFLSCINGNLSKQQTPGIFGLSSTATLLDLLKAAVDKALQSRNGHLDLFLRFLMGLSMESNSLVIKCLLTATGRSSLSKNAAETNKQIIAYIKKKIKKNPSASQSINLFHCLNELNDQSLVQEVQAFLSEPVEHCLDRVKLSAVQWSALVFLLLNSENELEEFNLQKFTASEECLKKLSPVVKMSRKALLCNSNLTEKSGDILARILISECSCLRELDMSDNKLQDSGVKRLSVALKNPRCKLEILRLSNCSLTEKSCVVIASVLTSTSTHLTELCLSRNSLQDTGVKHLSKALQSPDCKLTILRLHDCNITEEGCVALADALKSHSHLKELDLSANPE